MSRVVVFLILASFFPVDLLAEPAVLARTSTMPAHSKLVNAYIKCVGNSSAVSKSRCEKLLNEALQGVPLEFRDKLEADIRKASMRPFQASGVSRPSRASTPEIPGLAAATDQYIHCVFEHREFLRNLEESKEACRPHRDHVESLVGMADTMGLLERVDKILWERWANESARSVGEGR